MDPWQELVLNAWAYLLAAAASLVILAGCSLLAPRLVRRPFPLPRLRRGRWAGFEVAAAFACHLSVPAFVIGILDGIGFFDAVLGPGASVVRRTVLASPLSAVLTLAMTFMLLFGYSRTRPHHFGLSPARWPANAALGAIAFLALAPVAHLVFLVALVALPGKQDHLLEGLTREALNDWEWGFVAFQAVAAAPLLEELVFRGLVQGWLRRASLAGHTMLAAFTLSFGSLPLAAWLSGGTTEIDLAGAIAQAIFTLLLVLTYLAWLNVLWRRFQAEEPDELDWEPSADPPAEPDPNDEQALAEARRRSQLLAERLARPWQRRSAPLAIFGSAMLFAAAHPAWPTPVPLFVLGLGLGWLAQRTQSLVGPIVCHALFNVVACLTLYWGATGPQPTRPLPTPQPNGSAATTARVAVGSTVSAVPASWLPRRK